MSEKDRFTYEEGDLEVIHDPRKDKRKRARDAEVAIDSREDAKTISRAKSERRKAKKP